MSGKIYPAVKTVNHVQALCCMIKKTYSRILNLPLYNLVAACCTSFLDYRKSIDLRIKSDYYLT